ncbi:MAG TPA: hypothetical protein VEL76_15090 [Gemmataceae bacterium]|nr:hypothetical protein [Gemmataceae bacterium]
MKRWTRRVAWVGIALTVVVLALGVTERLLWQPGVTEANVRRLRAGMTLQEVENLLGGPSGNYSRIPDEEAGLWTIDPNRPDLNRQFFIGREVWIGDAVAVAVWFDAQGRVVRKESYQTLNRGPLQGLRDLLGR